MLCDRKTKENKEYNGTKQNIHKGKGIAQAIQPYAEDLAIKSGEGLRFLRELEQGKPKVRMDKVNQVLNLFSPEVGVCAREKSSYSQHSQASSTRLQADSHFSTTKTIFIRKKNACQYHLTASGRAFPQQNALLIL